MGQDVKVFTTGVADLDKLIGVVKAPYTVLVAGHPGAGKTTLASTICYSNALKGRKCLYVSFYEDKEKLYSYMERVGLRLWEAESRNQLRYLKFPVTLDLESLIEVLNKNLEEGFEVVVVDSINVLLEAAREHADKRAWLLNYFYQLPSAINGLLVLVSELPFGEEKLGLGSVEFMVDAMIVLKHRIEDRMLVRLLEVRKARGAPIHLAEVPFSIVENRGIEVLFSPRLEELPKEGEPLEFVCETMARKINHIHKNFFINIFYHPGSVYGEDDLIMLLALAVKYKWRILVVSYVSPPDLLRDAIAMRLSRFGLGHKYIEELLDKHLVLRAINPYAYSINELALREYAMLAEANSDIVVFHGVHALAGANFSQHFKSLYNEVIGFKSRGIGVVRIGSCVDEDRCKAESSIADLTIRIEPVFKDTGFEYRLLVFRRFREPVIVTRDEFLKCINECVETLKQKAL